MAKRKDSKPTSSGKTTGANSARPQSPAPKDALQGAFEQAGGPQRGTKSGTGSARPSKPPEDVDAEEQDERDDE